MSGWMIYGWVAGCALAESVVLMIPGDEGFLASLFLTLGAAAIGSLLGRIAER